MGTISKALVLLNHFSATVPELTLSDFKKLSRQDKATVYRHLCELEQNGFLEQNPASKAYRIGPAVLRLSAIRERTFPVRKVVAEWVDELSRDLGELVHFSLLQGIQMSPVYHANLHTHGTGVQFDEADMLPLHATSSGMAMLAFGPESLLEETVNGELEQYSQMTILEPEILIKHVNTAREKGYACCDQGFEIDVYSFAVPVFNEMLLAIGTLAVALPTSRMNDAMQKRIVSGLKDTSANITRSLGGAVPHELEKLWNKAA